MTTPTARLATVTDRQWVRQSFMLSRTSVSERVREWQNYCSADSKFTSARLGNNFVINPLPQYTVYADPRRMGLLRPTNTNQTITDDLLTTISFADRTTKKKYLFELNEQGMGHYYSEQLDDNYVSIAMRFGVPEFNGMFSFFTGFYDGEAATLANQGLVNSIFFSIGKLAGFVLTIRAWPLMLINAIGNIGRFAAGMPASKYYYMQPTMYSYWTRVNYIANTLAVNMGIVPRGALGFFQAEGENAKREQVGKELNKHLHDLDPQIFREDGGIDVYALATKTQRLADRRFTVLQEKLDNNPHQELDSKGNINTAYADYFHSQMKAFAMDNGFWQPEQLTDVNKRLEDYLGRYFNGITGAVVSAGTDLFKAYTDPSKRGRDKTPEELAYVQDTARQDAADVQAPNNFGTDEFYSKNLRPTWDYSVTDAQNPDSYIKYPSWWGDFKQQLAAEVREGSQFISFRVDNPGTTSESFNNSTRESDIAGKINGKVSSARNARFTVSNGNVGQGLIDSVTGAVRNLAAGFLDGVHLSGLLSLAGAAFVDIPKVWDNSSASFPTASYTIKLRSPYGNQMSRFTNIYVPLSCLLAAALPLSTGKQSYTAPFLCELYSRGRNAIRLGMIESLSITRGTGSLGWNNNGQALGIDVSFTVADLSTVMHAPIDDRAGTFLPPWKGLIDDDNAFNDYLNVLSSMALEDMIYPSNKFIMNLTRKAAHWNNWGTGFHIGSALMSTLPGRILTGIAANPEYSVNR